MNREEHLRANLPRWLQLRQIAELVIVDWSNRTDLTLLCSLDRRIRVVRVEGEPNWILSYAYNVGVTAATQPHILKCDADCVPTAAVFAAPPGPHHFLAGFWQSGAAVGKRSVNGQCFFSREQFDAINGYSEVIRTYGRDDEDFYDRLMAAGFARREIPPDQLGFIEHTDSARIANQFDSRVASPRELIVRLPAYNEMRNAYLAGALPWSRESRRATYATVSTGERWCVLRRDRSTEVKISPETAAQAHLFALRYIAAQLAGITVAAAERFDERACVALIVARQPRAAAAR